MIIFILSGLVWSEPLWPGGGGGPCSFPVHISDIPVLFLIISVRRTRICCMGPDPPDGRFPAPAYCIKAFIAPPELFHSFRPFPHKKTTRYSGGFTYIASRANTCVSQKWHILLLETFRKSPSCTKSRLKLLTLTRKLQHEYCLLVWLKTT